MSSIFIFWVLRLHLLVSEITVFRLAISIQPVSSDHSFMQSICMTDYFWIYSAVEFYVDGFWLCTVCRPSDFASSNQFSTPPPLEFSLPGLCRCHQDILASKLLYFSVFVHFVLFEAVSLHSPGCPETHFVAQGGLKPAPRPRPLPLYQLWWR